MFEQLKQVLASKFQLDADAIEPASTLKGLELDSLDLVEFSLVIEKEWGVRISDDELGDVQELDSIARLVAARGAQP